MQDQVNEKTAALTVRGTRLTGQMLARAMRAYLAHSRKPKSLHLKNGRQSVRSLSKQGASLADITIDDGNIGSFKKAARKYKVDYALKRDDSETTPRWIVFFKARDSKALESAFAEYTRSMMRREQMKPSMLERLAKYKELATVALAPVRNRDHGGREL